MISLLGKSVCDEENLLEKSIHITEMMKFLRTICNLRSILLRIYEWNFSLQNCVLLVVIFFATFFQVERHFFNFISLTRQQRDKTHMYIYRRNFMLNKIRVRLNLENSMWNLLLFYYFQLNFLDPEFIDFSRLDFSSTFMGVAHHNYQN